MSDDPYLAAIREQPDDALTRLVYADWLDERDDPRGEFLRLEVEAVWRADDDPAIAAIRSRLNELAAAIDVRWVRAVCRVPVECGPAFAHPRRHPLNVPGPFYTCGGCLACEAPEVEAPELLAPLRDGNYITHFVRQPRTTPELDAARRAILVCCVNDLRYGGTDPRVIAMLGNHPDTCDYLVRDDSPVLVRADTIALPNLPAIENVEQPVPSPDRSTNPYRLEVGLFESLPGESPGTRWRRWARQVLILILPFSIYCFLLFVVINVLTEFQETVLMLYAAGFLASATMTVLTIRELARGLRDRG